MWVPLMEKAYAKIHNCYQNLEAGSISQGLMDLTGEVCAVLCVRVEEKVSLFVQLTFSCRQAPETFKWDKDK